MVKLNSLCPYCTQDHTNNRRKTESLTNHLKSESSTSTTTIYIINSKTYIMKFVSLARTFAAFTAILFTASAADNKKSNLRKLTFTESKPVTESKPEKKITGRPKPKSEQPDRPRPDFDRTMDQVFVYTNIEAKPASKECENGSVFCTCRDGSQCFSTKHCQE
jgi:hypothetical protein